MCQFLKNYYLQLFCRFSILRRRHGVVLAEETVEGTTVGDAAHFDDESHGVVSRRKQFGGVANAVEVEEVGGRGVGTLMQGCVHILIVGAKEAGQRLMVRIGIGIDFRLFHQLAQTTVELLILC